VTESKPPKPIEPRSPRFDVERGLKRVFRRVVVVPDSPAAALSRVSEALRRLGYQVGPVEGDAFAFRRGSRPRSWVAMSPKSWFVTGLVSVGANREGDQLLAASIDTSRSGQVATRPELACWERELDVVERAAKGEPREELLSDEDQGIAGANVGMLLGLVVGLGAGAAVGWIVAGPVGAVAGAGIGLAAALWLVASRLELQGVAGGGESSPASPPLAQLVTEFRMFLVADDPARADVIGRTDTRLLQEFTRSAVPRIGEIDAALDELVSRRHPLPPDLERLEHDLHSLAQAAIEAQLELQRRAL
jgi:hypothetical protein